MVSVRDKTGAFVKVRQGLLCKNNLFFLCFTDTEFFTNWFAETLRQANLSTPLFFHCFLLTLCFCVKFWYFLKYFKCLHYVFYGDLWSVIFVNHCNCFEESHTMPILPTQPSAQNPLLYWFEFLIFFNFYGLQHRIAKD